MVQRTIELLRKETVGLEHIGKSYFIIIRANNEW